MGAMNPYWKSLREVLSAEQQERADKFQNLLRNSGDKLASRLADPSDPKTLSASPNDARRLAARIRELSGTATAAAECIAIVRSLIRRLNIDGAQLAFPPVHLPVSWPANRLDISPNRVLRCMRAWLKVLDERCIEEGSEPPLGLLLLSSILRSGVLSLDSLYAFVLALQTLPSSLRVLPACICLDLRVRWPGNQEPQRRMVELDSQTTALLRNSEAQSAAVQALVGGAKADIERHAFRPAQRRVFTKQTFKAIEDVLSAGKLSPEEMPGDLADLLTTAAAALALELPPMAIDYADGTIIANSLKTSSLVAIYGQVLGPSSPEDTKEDVPSVRSATTSGDGLVEGGPIEDLPDGLGLLRDALRGHSVADTLTRLQEIEQRNEHSIEPVWPLLAGFAVALLKPQANGVRRVKAIALSTARAIVINRLGTSLGVLLENDNPVNLSAAELEATYAEALQESMEAYQSAVAYSASRVESSERDARARAHRNRVEQAVWRFHKYLQDTHGAPELEMASPGSGGSSILVNAHILSMGGFQAARRKLQALRTGAKDDFLYEYAEALLIIGFRFGLRWSETHGLMARDIFDDWLFVRPSGYRGLKTINSLRKLPTHPLIPNDELEVLLHLRDAAVREGRTFVFSAPLPTLTDNRTAERPIVKSRLMSVVRLGLHSTGNGELRYHHLRHSCATWSFWRLSVADLPTVPAIFVEPETNEWLTGTGQYIGQDCRSFRRALLGEGPNRKALEAVSSLLGHSGTCISTEHYIHLFDRMLPAFLRQNLLLKTTTKQVICAAGLSDDSQPYAIQQREAEAQPRALGLGAPGWPGWAVARGSIERQFPTLVQLRCQPPNSGEDGNLGSDQTAGLFWKKPLDFLGLVSKSSGRSVAELAHESDISVAEGELLLLRLDAIQHRIGARKVDFSELKNRHDRAVAVYYAEPLRRLIAANPKAGRKFLHEFVHRRWETKNYGPFHNPKNPADAIAYRDFLFTLALLATCSRVHHDEGSPVRTKLIPELHYHFLGASTEDEPQSRNHRLWRSALKLGPDQSCPLGGENPARATASCSKLVRFLSRSLTGRMEGSKKCDGCHRPVRSIVHHDRVFGRSDRAGIGIELLVGSTEQNAASAKSFNPNSARTFGGPGFRFLFTAAALVFGFELDSQQATQ